MNRSVNDYGTHRVLTVNDEASVYVGSTGAATHVLIAGVDFSFHFLLSPDSTRELAGMLIAQAEKFDCSKAEIARLTAERAAL